MTNLSYDISNDLFYQSKKVIEKWYENNKVEFLPHEVEKGDKQ